MNGSQRRSRSVTTIALTALVATGLSVVSTTAEGPAAEAATTAASAFEPVTPCRLLDTRDGERLGARKFVDVQVADRCGVPDDATAVAVTITVVQPDAPGFVVGYPAGTKRPTASSVNYQPGEVIANLQLLQLGSGAIRVYSLAATDVVVDVSGAFVPASSGRSRAGRFVPTEPTREIDTRAARRPAPKSTVRVRTDVPDDAVAVAVNITTTATKGPDVFTAFAAGGDLPLASSLNVDAAGQTRAAAAIVPVNNGDFDVYTLRGNHVIVDVVGFYTGPTAERSSTGLFVSERPTRLVDSREAYGPSGGPRLWAGGAREFSIEELAGGSISAVAANVTVTDTEDAGFVVLHPAGTPRPATSTLNYDRPSRTVANLAMTGVSDRGITVYALDATEFVVDITGWFTGEPLVASGAVPKNSPPPDRRVTIIGDSASAGMRWNGALGGLQGFQVDARLESCRRLVQWSCRGREGYAPRTAVSEIQSMAPAGIDDILVVMTGYNDWHERFNDDFDTVVGAARQRGFHHIVWIDYRSNVGYTLPSSGGSRSNYGEMNRIIGEKLASGAFPEVRRWHFDAYTAGTSIWFHGDGVHETTFGSWGVADWISRHVRAFDDRPCAQPLRPGEPIPNPCPDPDTLPGTVGYPDIAGLYPAAVG